VLNVAVDEGSYGYEQDGAGVANSAYIGYLFGVTNTNVTNVYVDGLVYDVVTGLEGDKLLVDKNDSDTFTSADCPSSNLGADTDVQCGSSITYANTTFFTDPANRDFTINDTTNLQGTAVPVAEIQVSETDTVLDVTAAQCFFDDWGGIRSSGDVLDIAGDECIVTGVDYVNGQITCSSAITVATGDDIYFKVAGAVHDDIGAIAAASSGPGNPTPGPGVNLKRVFYDGP
jgi:hypothetical protein